MKILSILLLLCFVTLPVTDGPALNLIPHQNPTSINAPGVQGNISSATSSSSFNESIEPMQFTNWAAWNGYMSHTPLPQAGCFSATYPSTVWQLTQCVAAPLLPLLPSLPSIVGNGNDEVAYSSGTLIGSSIGSFQVSGLTSETDSKYGANNYGLQVNSQTFTTSTTYTGGKSTSGWEQFVWLNWPYSNSVGYGYIQYWLLGYQTSYGSCPSTGPPGGSSWMAYSGSCYANSPGTSTPLEAATNLVSLSLEGFSNYNNGANDVDIFCIYGGSCYSATITDQVVNLYQNWHYSEFNVFGAGSGSQANFNSGTTITVTNTLKDQSGNVIVPSCVNTGYTGETNNLNLGSCSSNSNGQIVFTESNALTQTLTTNVASGSGSVSPTCPSGCSETVGSSVTVTATPSSGWKFSSWSISGDSCSGGSSSNPCAFTMPYNPVTVSARFTQLPTISTDQTTYSQGDPIQYTGSAFTPNGQIHACLTTDNAANAVCTSEPNADGSGNVAGTMVVGTNIPPGPQKFWVYDVSTSTNSNSVQLTILELTLTATQTTTTTSTSTSTSVTSSTLTSGTTTTTTATSTSTVPGQVCTITTTSISTSVMPQVATTTSSTTSTTTTTTSTTSTFATTTAFTSTSTSITVTTTTLTQCTQTVTSTSMSTTTTTSLIPKVTMDVDYVIIGGGSPPAPTFNYVQGGLSKNYVLTGNPTPISVDAATAWSVTPNPLAGSSSERWESNQSLSGAASDITVIFTYYHQYYLTTQAAPLAEGSVSPDSEWLNSSSTMQVQATAAPSYAFSTWTGVGPGSYSGTSNPVTITMNGPITETANFDFPLSSAGSAMLSASADSVYFIFPDGNTAHKKPTGVGHASVTDWTALGFAYGSLTNMPQTIALDTDSTVIDQSTGAPKVSNKTIVLFGGPLVNEAVHYYESNAISPLHWGLVGGFTSGTEYYYNRLGQSVASIPLSVLGPESQDMGLIEAFMDPNGNTVIIFSGFGWQGTFVSGVYFKTVLIQQLSTMTDSWYIYSWSDTNGNGFAEVSEVTPTPVHGN